MDEEQARASEALASFFQDSTGVWHIRDDASPLALTLVARARPHRYAPARFADPFVIHAVGTTLHCLANLIDPHDTDIEYHNPEGYLYAHPYRMDLLRTMVRVCRAESLDEYIDCAMQSEYQTIARNARWQVNI